MTIPDEATRAEATELIRRMVRDSATYAVTEAIGRTAELGAAIRDATITVTWGDEVNEQALKAGHAAARGPLPCVHAEYPDCTGCLVRAAIRAAAPLIRAPLEAEVERLRHNSKLADLAMLRYQLVEIAVDEVLGAANVTGKGAADDIRVIGQQLERLRAQLAEAEDAIGDYAAALENERARVLDEVDAALRGDQHWIAWCRARGRPHAGIDSYGRRYAAAYLRDTLAPTEETESRD